MHNALTRAQNVFGFMTTCAFTLASIIAVLSLLSFPSPTSQPTAAISVRDIRVVKGRPHYYSTKREEYAQIKFDLDADLSGLFTWNTKQLFVYVTAVYPPSGAMEGEAQSEAVIWDIIIPATSTPWSYRNLKASYFPEKLIKGKKAPKKRVDTKTLVKPGVLKLKNQKPKYQITDPSGVLSERRNATLEVNWNVQPWVGALTWDKGYLGSRVGKWAAGSSGKSETFDFPPLKGSRSAEAMKEREAKKTAEAENPPETAEVKPAVSI
jgi:signal peptidase complex subunit 3